MSQPKYSLQPFPSCMRQQSKEFPRELTRKEIVAWNSFAAVTRSSHQAENCVELVETLVRNYSKMFCRMNFKVHMMMLILIKSRRKCEHTQRSKASASTRIYLTLNASTMNNIRKHNRAFGGCFVGEIYNIIINLKQRFTSKYVVVIFV